MSKVIAELLTSKKAIAAAVGVFLAVTNRYGLQLPEEAINQIIAALVSYVIGQGLADFGKNATGVSKW